MDWDERRGERVTREMTLSGMVGMEPTLDFGERGRKTNGRERMWRKRVYRERCGVMGATRRFAAGLVSWECWKTRRTENLN